MNRIERIGAMESVLRRGEEAAGRLEEAVAEYAALLPEMRKLAAYYGSHTWYADRRADETGKLPPDLPRGVLGEDETWDLLERNRELLRDLLALAAEMA